MTLEEFLRWDDGTDTRYELIRGVPVPGPLQPTAHGILLARLCSLFHPGLAAQREHVALVTAAIASPTESNSCYLADLVVRPLPVQWHRQLTPDPIVIVEVLSGSTAFIDREIKRPDYRCIPSVQEILLINSSTIRVELWQRRGFGWHCSTVTDASATIKLASAGVEISIAELYEVLVFPSDFAA